MPGTQSWNPGLALERLNNDHDLFRDMMRIFLQEAPAQLDALRNAIESQNENDAEQVAHRLKGDLGYLSAADVAECARKVEAAAAGGDLSHAGEMLARLEQDLEAIFSTMHRLCEDERPFRNRK